MLRRLCLRFCATPAPVSVSGCGACPSSCCAGAGVHPCVFIALPFMLFIYHFCLLCLFVLCVSQPKNAPCGYAIWTHDMTSDWVALGFPPRTSRTLSIALTGGHDSMFLRHPAIDTVWQWPCLPRFRLFCPLVFAVRLVVF